MFRAERAPAYLRRPGAGETLALRARRQTARSHLQLGRVQSEQLSEAETRSPEEARRRAVAIAASIHDQAPIEVTPGPEAMEAPSKSLSDKLLLRSDSYSGGRTRRPLPAPYDDDCSKPPLKAQGLPIESPNDAQGSNIRRARMRSPSGLPRNIRAGEGFSRRRNKSSLTRLTEEEAAHIIISLCV